MNDTMTELIFFTNEKPKSSDIASIHVGDTEVLGKGQVKLLGTLQDKKLTLKAHVKARTKTAFYKISLIRNVQNLLIIDTTKTLISALAQIDYLNSIPANCSYSTIKPYQKVHNLQPE